MKQLIQSAHGSVAEDVLFVSGSNVEEVFDRGGLLMEVIQAGSGWLGEAELACGGRGRAAGGPYPEPG